MRLTVIDINIRNPDEADALIKGLRVGLRLDKELFCAQLFFAEFYCLTHYPCSQTAAALCRDDSADNYRLAIALRYYAQISQKLVVFPQTEVQAIRVVLVYLAAGAVLLDYKNVYPELKDIIELVAGKLAVS